MQKFKKVIVFFQFREGNAAKMSAALISACIIAVAMLATAAEPQYKVVGEGLLSKPFSVNGPPKKGMRYAGPVVYTNEKPPIIFFPPPPKDAKPGFGGLSLFGKNKSPKSIKYVPMPHHDLPVLIYTSDKMPPIHVVQPSKNELLGSFRPPREDYRSPYGSLSSTYRGILPEATSSHVVSSSYEIPSTSYGSPVKAFGSSLGSLDLSFTGSPSEETSPQNHEQFTGLGFGSMAPPVSQPISNNLHTYKFRHTSSNKKVPPHVLYSGHPPIHVFNEPDMFVQAPKEVPLKTYADMPPKASFGPSKSSFGPSSIDSFGAPHSHDLSSLASFNSPYSGSSFSIIPARENLISSASSQTPTTIISSPNSAPKGESNQASVSPSQETSQSNERPPTYSFNPPQTMFSFGPFSIEYGPPSEPFMSFSEPTGSLSSIYGTIKEDATGSKRKTEVANDEGWIPGPPPDIPVEQQKKETWDTSLPQRLPSYKPQMRPPPPFHGPRYNPMHGSVLLPSGPSAPLFGGSRLAHLLSAFKMKRSKPKYAIAPKSMHKPPIIIYYGKKPPIHVYRKPDEEAIFDTAAYSTSAVAVTSAESFSSDGGVIDSDISGGNNKESVQSTLFQNADLTYDSSQKTEVRITAPPSPSPPSKDEKPAIIPAKPVDIFTSPDLQPSIYRARNSLNTILVSDLNGSGANSIKTYILRSNDDSSDSTYSRTQTQEAGVSTIDGDNNNSGSTPFAQDRISGRVVADQIPNASVPVSENEKGEQTEDNGDSNTEDMTPTIVLAVGTPKQETQEPQSQASEPTAAVIQSPSSFQTSLSQAEKDAEEAVEASSS